MTDKRDAALLALTADEAYELGYKHGRAGVEGYWPDYPRTKYVNVPGVGRVYLASPEEAAYWHGWHEGEEGEDAYRAMNPDWVRDLDHAMDVVEGWEESQLSDEILSDLLD